MRTEKTKAEVAALLVPPAKKDRAPGTTCRYHQTVAGHEGPQKAEHWERTLAWGIGTGVPSLKKLSFLALVLCLAFTARAQWATATSGPDIYYDPGNVGIGTTAPQTKLDLGGLRFDVISNFPAEGSVSEGKFGNYIIGDVNSLQRLRLGVSNDNYTRSEIFLDNSDRPDGTISFKTASGNGGALTRMFIDGSGNVGIGTSSPQSTLHVVGDIGVGKMQDGSSAGMMVSYDDGTGGSGTTTFRHARWGGDFYFTRSDASGTDRNQLHFGGLSNHYLDVYDNSNNVTVHLNSKGDTYFNGGNMGIGTTVPQSALQVAGDVGVGKVQGGSSAGMKVSYDDGTGGTGTTTFRHVRWGGDFYFTRADASGTDRTQLHFGGSSSHSLDVYDNSNNVTVHLNSKGDTYFNGGNVGIGTASPDAKLAVSGQVHAQEVKVSATVPGPDYVFEKNYKMPTLDSVKAYVDKNRHLPEIPSASEMEKDGIQLGEMNMLLLKKIEELTLYVIELKKENVVQQKEIEKLKK